MQKSAFIILFVVFAISNACKNDDNQINGSAPFPEVNALNPNLEYDSIFDIDGNSYAVIEIGNQTWMAENLRTTRFCNGDIIENILSSTEWQDSGLIAWAYFDNDSRYNKITGKLYTWYAAADQRNICPCGWHVPTESDWNTLINSIDPSADGGNVWPNFAGSQLKSAGTDVWETPNLAANNQSGFSALPGGHRYINGTFNNFGLHGYWWSATESNALDAWYRAMFHGNGIASRASYEKGLGLAIRCIKD
jgi:uncharacterized protein (TIGR02145 family)